MSKPTEGHSISAVLDNIRGAWSCLYHQPDPIDPPPPEQCHVADGSIYMLSEIDGMAKHAQEHLDVAHDNGRKVARWIGKIEQEVRDMAKYGRISIEDAKKLEGMIAVIRYQ